MEIPAGFFNEGNYIIDVMVIEKSSKGYFNIIDEQNVLTFQILPEKRELDSWMGKEPGFIKTRFDWIY
jgi:lipopolysaccharide transport system ATP-binding protein